MEEWKEYKLKDVTTILGDGLHGTPKYDENGSIFFINGNNLIDGKIEIRDSTKRVSENEANKYRKNLNSRTILVSINGTIGNVAKYRGEACILGKSACYFNVAEDFDLNFMYYVVASKQFKNAITHLATGTTIKNVSLETMRNYSFIAPSIYEQKRIANILSSLDDKIELNRRINENLEQQAQALFKSWFIDFEPFKDGKFVDSELGMIPEGWKVIETNKFMTISKESINPSKNPNCFYAHYSIPAFDEKSMPIFQYGNEIKSNKQKVSDNMTLVSKLNPRIKRIWFIDKACENAICSTEFIPYISLNNSPYFLYCYLDSDVFYNSIMGSVNGATGSHQRFQANDTLKFLFPYNEEVIYKFNLVVSGILKHKSRLIIENQKLSQLRDTLLPRLMSGELEIKDNSYD